MSTRDGDKKLTRTVRRQGGMKRGYALHVILLLFVIAGVLIAWRLYDLQIRRREALSAKAAEQQFVIQAFYPKRGDILDRNGYPLVQSANKYRVGMTPSVVTSYQEGVDSAYIAEHVARLLELSEDDAHELKNWIDIDTGAGIWEVAETAYRREHTAYVTLAKNVPESQAERLSSWLSDHRVSGFRLDAEDTRVYTNPYAAAPLLGLFRTQFGTVSGESGLEAAYNDVLAGTPGYRYVKRNNYATQGAVPFSTPIMRPGRPGKDIITCLDHRFQSILSEELLTTAAATGSIKGITGIIMDPYTGDVLAMDQVPTYRADEPDGVPLGFTDDRWEALGSEARMAYIRDNLWTNQNIETVFEPGSTFKAVTLAIGLEEEVTGEHVIYSDDPVTVRGRTMYCLRRNGHGDETLREAFYRSCNPVFVRMGQEIGLDRFYEYIDELNFKGKTGIDVGGETTGIFHVAPTELDFANLTFGESSAVTPLQIARFYSIIANGGYMVTPRVVSGYREAHSDVTEARPIAAGDQVFSSETCERVRSMMRDVVYEGYNDTFGSEGFVLGGKTGTSTNEIDDTFVYSFCAITPVDKPQYVIFVAVRAPVLKVESSVIASRCCNRISARLLNLTGQRQQYSEADRAYLSRCLTIPDLSGYTVGEAARELSDRGLAPNVPTDQFFLDQPLASLTPASGSKVGRGCTVWLSPEASEQTEEVAVPDFAGKTYHECVWLAADAGVAVVPVGSLDTTCTAQDILPSVRQEKTDESGRLEAPDHAFVPKGTVIRLAFKEGVDPSETKPVDAPVYTPPEPEAPETPDALDPNAESGGEE